MHALFLCPTCPNTILKFYLTTVNSLVGEVDLSSEPGSNATLRACRRHLWFHVFLCWQLAAARMALAGATCAELG
jgi:hypothetical protein